MKSNLIFGVSLAIASFFYSPLMSMDSDIESDFIILKVIQDSPQKINEEFFSAAMFHNLPKLKELHKKKGADINFQSSNWYHTSALHQVCLNGHKPTVKYLIKKKIDVDLKNKSNETALHYAVKNGDNDLEIVQLLLDAGIDLKAKNRDGKTALQVAQAKQKEYAKQNIPILYEQTINLLINQRSLKDLCIDYVTIHSTLYNKKTRTRYFNSCALQLLPQDLQQEIRIVLSSKNLSDLCVDFIKTNRKLCDKTGKRYFKSHALNHLPVAQKQKIIASKNSHYKKKK